MNVGCIKCKKDAQLIADVNEFEREMKILGIPKAIISLAELALQVWRRRTASEICQML